MSFAKPSSKKGDHSSLRYLTGVLRDISDPPFVQNKVAKQFTCKHYKHIIIQIFAFPLTYNAFCPPADSDRRWVTFA